MDGEATLRRRTLRGVLRGLLTEPRRPVGVRTHPRAPWLVVATVCVGAFMGQLDASIVTLAFPTLEREFSVDIATVEWVALAYLVVLVATLTPTGTIADMVGRKLLYSYGFFVFAAASVACGLAPNLGVLIGFRAIQAVGAAMLQANSVALIATALPKERVGQGLGIQGAAQALGLALGPTIGGVLVDTLGWRWIFFVNGPVGVLGLVSAWFLLPRSRDLALRSRFDWVGWILFAPALALGLVALSRGQHGGYTSVPVIAGFTACVVLLGLFIVRERLTPYPMLDLRLFANKTFSVGILAGLLGFLVLFGTLFVVPFYAENARHTSPALTGLVLTAVPAAIGIAAPWAGRRAGGPRASALGAGGLALTAVALLASGLWKPPIDLLVVCLAGIGAGLGLFTAPNNTAVMNAAPRHRSSQAAGVLNTTRALGSALGIAVGAGVFDAVASAPRTASAAESGFAVTALVLAGIAGAAAALASSRVSSNRHPRGDEPTPS
ncbi:MAG: DHA2 family efflux MFS transporter permease subunit [Acidothermus sp.]|nr:DHA2 family efflux MFS transporter permease subunit [Acidothermus sp.]MCL6537533.1 DHA2 family efflux MFS transporter permease subunit [Acidothermus sp.]